MIDLTLKGEIITLIVFLALVFIGLLFSIAALIYIHTKENQARSTRNPIPEHRKPVPAKKWKGDK